MNYIQSSRDRENTNIETNLCFSWINCCGNREYTILNNVLTKSLGSGRADEEEDDDDKESADVEDDSVEDDKTEDEDKSPDEKIMTLIQSTVDYSVQHDKNELSELMNGFRKDVWRRLSRCCPRIGRTRGCLLTGGKSTG